MIFVDCTNSSSVVFRSTSRVTGLLLFIHYTSVTIECNISRKFFSDSPLHARKKQERRGGTDELRVN